MVLFILLGNYTDCEIEISDNISEKSSKNANTLLNTLLFQGRLSIMTI